MIQYRPNVAVILENSRGEIFVAERGDIPGAWQFPQGGIDDGETPEEAMRREIEEEIGLGPEAIEVAESRGGYRYRFPEGIVKWKKYRGQEQTYFRCRFLGKDEDINVQTQDPEFTSWRWISPGDFDLEWLPDFKREVYARVLRDFYG